MIELAATLLWLAAAVVLGVRHAVRPSTLFLLVVSAGATASSIASLRGGSMLVQAAAFVAAALVAQFVLAQLAGGDDLADS